MRYEILGPLRVVDGNDISCITAQKIEILLAVLLIRADQLVPADQLRGEIWDCHAPRRATAGLHVYISQLRKFLHRPHRADSPILTRSPGYQLRLGDDELDLHLFLRTAERARACLDEGRDRAAVELFDEALALWKGPVLADVPHGPTADAFVTWLAEERLQCVELSMDAQLRLGRHRSLVGLLYSLTREYPLREAFYRQLMLALYRSECQADALKVYRAARQTLHQELGLEPCRTLQSLHQAILRADDRLDEYSPA